MEKIIVIPREDKNVILSHEVERLMEDEGIILVYDDETLVGSVVLHNSDYILSSINLYEEYQNLEELIKCNSHYTFKYIT